MKIGSIKTLSALFVALVVVFTLVVVSQGATTGKQHAGKTVLHSKITAAQAETTALQRFPGRIVRKTALEDEEGVWQYSVMVKSHKTLREIMVNAITGNIDNVEVTTASKEGVEAREGVSKAEVHKKCHRKVQREEDSSSEIK